ncbi:MAG: cobalamin biosynthesis protein CbiG [Dehalococcoidia bacterium]|nr:cobalamin biosynthesis protein CbiG [Dehalococcoidia bacterium]
MVSQPPLVLAISRPGGELAARIAEMFAGEFGARDSLTAAFREGRPIIAVGALGIWTRLLAPHLGDKLLDPPVVVVDDAGRFAIALTGGHHGGNALAARVAAMLGATPVLTTATDTLGLPSIEAIAAQYGWRLDASRAARLHVSAALVNGEPVVVFQDRSDRGWLSTLPAHARLLDTPPRPDEATAAIFVTDRTLPEISAWAECVVVLRPPTLVAGIGASQGVTAEEVLTLLRSVLDDNGFALASVATIATADLKRDEPGIVEAAALLGIPLRCFPTEALAAVSVPTPSAVVAQHVQTSSVCEAAALLASGARALLVEKRKSAHATVAIARISEVPA